jgi:hypothetical protein
MRILGEVGAREFERIKDNLGHCSAADPRGEDVAEFMDNHHSKPGQEENRKDQETLEEAMHFLQSIVESAPLFGQ